MLLSMASMTFLDEQPCVSRHPRQVAGDCVAVGCAGSHSTDRPVSAATRARFESAVVPQHVIREYFVRADSDAITQAHQSPCTGCRSVDGFSCYRQQPGPARVCSTWHLDSLASQLSCCMGPTPFGGTPSCDTETALERRHLFTHMFTCRACLWRPSWCHTNNDFAARGEPTAGATAANSTQGRAQAHTARRHHRPSWCMLT